MFGRRDLLRALARVGAGTLVSGALPGWARAASAPTGNPGRGVRPRAAAPADLIVRNDWPEHYETSVAALGRSWITRNDLFFVRSHFPVPDVDVES